MEQALAEARAAAERDEVPVGALLICQDRILGRGVNRREELCRTVAHAEIVALEHYSATTRQWRVPPGTTLIVTAEPCLMCTGALIWARVDRVLYGCSDPRDAGLRRVRPLIEAGTFDHRFTEIRGGILGDACGAVMSDFFRRKRKSGKPESTG
jgi:tRNA(adenine34) deaminase